MLNLCVNEHRVSGRYRRSVEGGQAVPANVAPEVASIVAFFSNSGIGSFWTNKKREIRWRQPSKEPLAVDSRAFLFRTTRAVFLGLLIDPGVCHVGHLLD